MNDTDLIDWLNWYAQGDDTATFEEEDGGVILHLKNDGEFIGTSVRDCLKQAAEAFPQPVEEP